MRFAVAACALAAAGIRSAAAAAVAYSAWVPWSLGAAAAAIAAVVNRFCSAQVCSFPNPRCDLHALKWEPHVLKALGGMVIKMVSQVRRLYLLRVRLLLSAFLCG